MLMAMLMALDGNVDGYLAVAKFSRDFGIRACNRNMLNPYTNQYYIE